MKRIFLTSGLVLCMACPAFANVEGALAGDPALECDYGDLNSYTGPVTLHANWISNFYEITLDPSTSQLGAGNTSISPTTLWGLVNDGVYATRTSNANGGFDFSGEFSASDTVFTNSNNSPVGKTVTYTINENWPTAYNSYTAEQKAAALTTAANVVASSTTFDGFYLDSDTSLQTRLINANKQITQEGIGRTTSMSGNETWVANYTCGSPTVTKPELVGYTSSWATAPGCIKDNGSLTVNWTAHTGTIVYDCGNVQGTTESFTTATTGIANDTSLVFDGTYTLTNTVPNCALPGYHFGGWICDHNLATGASNDTVYALEGATVTNGVVSGGTIANRTGTYKVAADNATITCKVKWEANNISLTWSDPAGGNEISGTSCTYDGTIELPATPSRTGYTFGGWTLSNPNAQ